VAALSPSSGFLLQHGERALRRQTIEWPQVAFGDPAPTVQHIGRADRPSRRDDCGREIFSVAYDADLRLPSIEGDELATQSAGGLIPACIENRTTGQHRLEQSRALKADGHIGRDDQGAHVCLRIDHEHAPSPELPGISAPPLLSVQRLLQEWRRRTTLKGCCKSQIEAVP
jgi:hypothetical protein